MARPFRVSFVIPSQWALQLPTQSLPLGRPPFTTDYRKCPRRRRLGVRRLDAAFFSPVLYRPASQVRPFRYLRGASASRRFAGNDGAPHP